MPVYPGTCCPRFLAVSLSDSVQLAVCWGSRQSSTICSAMPRKPARSKP